MRNQLQFLRSTLHTADLVSYIYRVLQLHNHLALFQYRALVCIKALSIYRFLKKTIYDCLFYRRFFVLLQKRNLFFSH